MLSLERVYEGHSNFQERVLNTSIELEREKHFGLKAYKGILTPEQLYKQVDLGDLYFIASEVFSGYVSQAVLEPLCTIIENKTTISTDGKVLIDGMRPLKGLKQVVRDYLTTLANESEEVNSINPIEWNFNTVDEVIDYRFSCKDWSPIINLEISYSNLDFLNCSENTTGWGSCFRNNGEYGASPTAFMTIKECALLTSTNSKGEKIGRRWLFKDSDDEGNTLYMLGKQYGTLSKTLIEEYLNYKFNSDSDYGCSMNIYCDNLYYNSYKGCFNPYILMEEPISFNGSYDIAVLFGCSCYSCDYIIDSEDDICVGSNGESYCRDCFDERFAYCAECADVTWLEDMFETSDGYYYCCETCASRNDYIEVNDDTYLYPIDDTYYCIDEEVYYCSSNYLTYHSGCENFEEGYYSDNYYNECIDIDENIGDEDEDS